MAENTPTNEPRALSAALAGPELVTRGAGVAMHVANRHVERWAPETGARRVRSLRTLGFVDRMVTPWLETATRSAGLRMFSAANRGETNERQGSSVSWVFPRPWYQDELDWMAAARQTSSLVDASSDVGRASVPAMLTTRGTYMTPAQQAMAPRPAMPSIQEQRTIAMPQALYEYVAPSLSIVSPQMAANGFAPVGRASVPANAAYSPLVPLAAVQAAQLAARFAPSVSNATANPIGFRSVLASFVERATRMGSIGESVPTRTSTYAPELVTPPHPRADVETVGRASVPATMSFESSTAEQADRIATAVAEQRVKIAELQRVSRQVAEREARETIVRQEAARASSSATSAPAPSNEPATVAAEQRARAIRAAEIAQRTLSSQQSSANIANANVEQQRAQQVAVETERARVEQQIAQRVAARRMHDQARSEAATHATQAPTASTAQGASAAPMMTPVEQPRVPSEVLAAIAALPPELHRSLAARPERMMQTINELGESLRTAELFARGAAMGRAPEVTRGPRLVMPAGLGGLVSTIASSEAPSTSTVAFGGSQQTAMRMPAFAANEPAQAARAVPALRMPTMPWIAPTAQASVGRASVSAAAPMNALSSTAAHAPTALQHVAWADRWLARFAGATTRSLDVLGATGHGASSGRSFSNLAGASPGEVFVAFDSIENAPRTTIDERGFVSSGSSYASALASRAPSMSDVVSPTLASTGPRRIETAARIDDDDETPDSVFASIAQAAAQQRRVEAVRAQASSASAAGSISSASNPIAAQQPQQESIGFVDRLTRNAPIAPADAGLSAGLSASPFAAALHHLLPITASRTFDVRALFGNEIGSTFLAGLIAPMTQEFTAGSIEQQMAPRFAQAFLADPTNASDPRVLAERLAPEFDATYVAPTEPTLAGDVAAGDVGRASVPAESVEQQLQQLTTLRSALLSWNVDAPTAHGMIAQNAPSMSAPNFATIDASIAGDTTTTIIAGSHAAGHGGGMPARASSPIYRAMVESMSLPMLGDSAAQEASGSSAAPGMIGARAHAFSVEQERSSADLSYDFVTPELVLAARVYGFGPTEAIQAMRLASAGPTQLAAMAGAVDRTFVQAMNIDRLARAEGAGVYGSGSGSSAAGSFAGSPGSSVAGSTGVSGSTSSASAGSAGLPGVVIVGSPTTVGSDAGITTAYPASTMSSAFGIERRAPRGAFLWPSATVAALNLDASASPDGSPNGSHAMSVAALELLAAQAVAEIGTYAAIARAEGIPQPGADFAGSSSSSSSSSVDGFSTMAGSVGSMPNVSTSTYAGSSGSSTDDAAASSPTARTARGGQASELGALAQSARRGADASEREVLDTVAALVPSTRRAKFDALYLALGQSPAGASWSPAARAARALAIASRDNDGVVTSAYERAATVWDVLPVVYANAMSAGTEARPTAATTSRRGTASSSSRGTAASRGRESGNDYISSNTGGPDFDVDSRPGLAGLSARAGEALGSYVTSSSAASALGASSAPAAFSGETVVQEYKRTPNRPSARAGGGETEIPAWFESAARKMFEERSGLSDGISMAELTLVASAPSNQIAASERSMSHATPTKSSTSPGQSAANPEIDVEKLAYEVYRHILDLMDAARSRNGEYL